MLMFFQRGRGKKDDSDLDSEDLDATDEEAPKAPARKTKGKGKDQSEKDLAKAKAKAKAEHEAKRQKRGEDEEPSEDEYKAPSKGVPIAPTALPPIGSFEKCAVCGKTFTVVRYRSFIRPCPIESDTRIGRRAIPCPLILRPDSSATSVLRIAVPIHSRSPAPLAAENQQPRNARSSTLSKRTCSRLWQLFA